MTGAKEHMHARALIFLFVSASILVGGCSDPNNQPATDSKGIAGEAAKHLMDRSRAAHAHYISPDKQALLDPAEPKEAVLSSPSSSPYHIGVCLAGSDADFDTALTAGIQEEAQKGKVTVDIVSAGGNAAKQAVQLADFTKSKENALIVMPVDSKTLTGELATLESAKIPIIGAGQPLAGAATDVLCDGQAAGAKAMIAVWGSVIKSQSGRVGIIAFASDPMQQSRAEGFATAAKQIRNVKDVFQGDISQNTADAAEAQAKKMLQDHPNITAFFAADDNLAAGVNKALIEAKSETDVISVGADADARQQIKPGSPWFADVIEYPHLIGVTSLDAAVKVLQGDKLPAKIAIPVGVVHAASFQ